MPYRVEFRPGAVRQFESLPRNVQQSLKPAIDELASNPRPPGVKKLQGEDNLYRIKAGPGKRYRVVYQVHDKILLVLVVAIAGRKDVYRRA